MKKICVILLILCFGFLSFSRTNKCFALTENVVYAKTKNGCVLYKSSELSKSIDNIYFVVPETYFVTVLDDTNDNCYKVQYDKYIGYVEKSFVEIATFIPIVKTLSEVKCDIKQTSGTQIWNKPSVSGDVLTTIAAGTKNISYTAMCYGDIPIGGVSNIWYYISYTPETNSTNVYEGYIYSENVTNLSEIVINLECNPIIVQDEIVQEENIINISSGLKTVITVLIAVPIILLISIILYKIIKKMQENTNKRQIQNKCQIENSLTQTRYISDNNEQTNSEINSLYYDQKYDLKNQINRMKNTSFVRSDIYKSNKYQNNKIPKFPTYTSEDDLL